MGFQTGPINQEMEYPRDNALEPILSRTENCRPSPSTGDTHEHTVFPYHWTARLFNTDGSGLVSPLRLHLRSASPGGIRQALTPDQRLIIDYASQSSAGETLQYVPAPTEPIGAEIKLPFRQGKHVTLVRKASIRHKDGSVSWRGEVRRQASQQSSCCGTIRS